MSLAKALTDSKEPRSTILTTTLSLPVSAVISFAASLALSPSLQAKMTLAPLCAKSNAVSLPIPVFAPVTIAVLPKHNSNNYYITFFKINVPVTVSLCKENWKAISPLWILPSSRALLLHTPPLKYHFISTTKQIVTPVTAISVLAVLWEMRLSPSWDKIETKTKF